MIRILHIVTYMGRGGLETLLMNCFRHIDREQVQFDFLVHRDFRADYDDEIEALGGKIYRLPRLNPISPEYYQALDTFFRAHSEYKIVHCHLDCMSAIPLFIAKKHGVPVRIAHSHNANQDRDWKYPLKLFFKHFIPHTATHFFACSRDAGSWMFPGQNVIILNNGIDAELFRFDSAVRAQMRDQLSLADALVIGHTGRFAPQKNHTFLIDIFREIKKRRPDSTLLLIGTGELEDSIRHKVDSLGLSESIKFLGSKPDVYRYLQAMDVFVMPSLYEGLSLASVEAQASGLPCFFSDTVSAECQMSDKVSFLPLSSPAEHWAEYILSVDISSRSSGHGDVRQAGFDIQSTTDKLIYFYQKHW